jgi:hypothetical protein
MLATLIGHTNHTIVLRILMERSIAPKKRTVQTMNKYYWFTFADGYSVCVKGFSKQELRVEENKHGKLIKKECA